MPAARGGGFVANGRPLRGGVATRRHLDDARGKKEVGEGVARHKEPSGALVSRAFISLLRRISSDIF